MRMFLLLILMTLLAYPAQAGFDEGVAALEREDYEAAFKEFLPLAEAGDPTSSWIVAKLYSEGSGVKRDKDKAFHFMRQAAEGGHPYGMTDLALFYTGGVKRDKTEARKWLIKAAETGRPEFQFILGAFYYEGWDAAEIQRSDGDAVHWIKLAAESGLPPAEYLMGVMVGQGRGVPADAVQAINWYRRAADHGVAEALSELGDFYSLGTERSCKDAVKWYRAAADYNLSYAFYRLAKFYGVGECVQQNFVQAHFWYSNAWYYGCRRDGSIMLERRSQLEKQMTKEEIHEADLLWRKWKGKGAPTFAVTGIKKFRLYPFPYVTLPKPYCGWAKTDN